MQLKCDYCDGLMTELDEACPHCGAVNPGYKRQGDEVPRTIEELKAWYVAHDLPRPEVTRFFIGVDYKEPKAFGIYQNGSRFIVYKNKDNGERAIRYDGGDEAYAVNEIYMKLRERIAEEKSRNLRQKTGGKKKKGAPAIAGLIALFAAVIGIATCAGLKEPSKGYYRYQGNQYYYLGDTWYLYDDYANSWSYTNVDDELSDHYSDYYESDDYDSSYGVSDFENTSYYSDWEASSWDDDDNWDAGDSWDSDGGDWGSDW